MTYRTTVLPNGRIDADALPDLPPGTFVEIRVPQATDPLDALLRELEEAGREVECGFSGTYTREIIYDDLD